MRPKNAAVHLTQACLLALPLLALPAHAVPILGAGYGNALTATLPGPNTNFYGDIAVDAAGNRYVTGGLGSSVYKVSAAGAVTAFVNPVNGSTVLGLEVVGDKLYVGSESSGLTRVDLATGAQTSLAAASGAPMAMAYGAGKLYVGTHSGLYAYDTLANTLSTTSILGSLVNSLAFAKDGKLLVSDYNNSRILSYNTSNNSSTVFRSGIGSVGGIAVHQPTGLVYAASESSSTLLQIAANGSASSVFATGFTTDGGYYPTALNFSNDFSSLYYLQSGANSSFQMHAINGFTPAQHGVPEPGVLALVLLGLGAAFTARRCGRS